jgi:hypothetical protein
MNKGIVRRLRILQPAARAATDLTAVREVISNLMPPNLGADPIALLAALPLLQGLLTELKSLRAQRGDESVDLRWEAEIKLDDGIRFGQGNCAAGAILCAIIEILSAMAPTED